MAGRDAAARDVMGCTCTRRHLGALAVASLAVGSMRSLAQAPEPIRHFIAEAERMRAEAVAAGDQPFGAVVVHAGLIVGYGPSRVVQDRDPNAHAERVALWDAQRRLGRTDLAGAIIYATSRPCGACETALAQARIARMHHGPEARDAGVPKAW